jgi:hypothetical protein
MCKMETYMNIEKLKHHIKSLKEKHKDLENQINESYIHYDPDLKIKDLKIKKLQVKKEIEWLEKEIDNA